MARPTARRVSYSTPSKEERAQGAVVVCDGCGRSWPHRLAVLRLKKCVNCARSWWRKAQAAHRAGESAPPLRRPKVKAQLPENVDAFLAALSMEPEPVKRGPRVQEERHDPSESIDSIVARMGAEVTVVPALPSSRGSRDR